MGELRLTMEWSYCARSARCSSCVSLTRTDRCIFGLNIFNSRNSWLINVELFSLSLPLKINQSNCGYCGRGVWWTECAFGISHHFFSLWRPFNHIHSSIIYFNALFAFFRRRRRRRLLLFIRGEIDVANNYCQWISEPANSVYPNIELDLLFSLLAISSCSFFFFLSFFLFKGRKHFPVSGSIFHSAHDALTFIEPFKLNVSFMEC